jgi:hypothetical protein
MVADQRRLPFQQSAALLNISRPYVVGMIDAWLFRLRTEPGRAPRDDPGVQHRGLSPPGGGASPADRQ